MSFAKVCSNELPVAYIFISLPKHSDPLPMCANPLKSRRSDSSSSLAVMLTDAFPCLVLHRRNLSCIGCGCPRSPTGSNNNIASDLPQSPHSQQFVLQQPPPPSARPMQSPRFASPMNYRGSPNIYALPSQSPTSYAPNFQHGYASSSSGSSNGHQPSSSPLASPTFNKSTSAHPLLTPSGRAFASGGKVQNISSDPLSPCIMYWPDNEPFPEQGQIRPSGLMGVPVSIVSFAFILRCLLRTFLIRFLSSSRPSSIRATAVPFHMCVSFLHTPGMFTNLSGQQPGDWICLKCNYLNWRRRKVCQTCLPCGFQSFVIRSIEIIDTLDRCRRQWRLDLSCRAGGAYCPSHLGPCADADVFSQWRVCALFSPRPLI